MTTKSLPEFVREQHKLLNIIRTHQSADRILLCEQMELSWPTIQKITDKLKENKILKDPSSSGKSKNTEIKKEEFAINSESGYYVGISVGGSQIKFCLINMDFSILSPEKFFGDFVDKYSMFSKTEFHRNIEEKNYGYLYRNTPSEFGRLQEILNDILSEIIKLDKILRSEGVHIFGVGFAFTGAIDNKKKSIVKSFNLDCFDFLPMQYDSLIYAHILSYFIENDINITFENIAKAALISEKFALYQPFNLNYMYRNRKNIACIYLGSGVGSAFILNNTFYRGTNNYSELGHIDVIDPEDLISEIQNKNTCPDRCTCGGKNCLEHKIRKVVFDMSMDEFKSYTATELHEYFFTHLGQQEKRLEILAFYVGQAIKTEINLLNLDFIILTGKITRFKELEKYLAKEKAKNPIGYTNSACTVRTSTYGALAPSIGAAIMSSFPDDAETIEWRE